MISIALWFIGPVQIVHWLGRCCPRHGDQDQRSHVKAAKKPPAQNSRNVPEQRAESPDGFLDFSLLERAGPPTAALNQIPYRPTPSNRAQLLSGVARWHRLPTGG